MEGEEFATTRVAGSSSPHRSPPGRGGEPARPAHPMVPESGRTPAVYSFQMNTTAVKEECARGIVRSRGPKGTVRLERNPCRGPGHPGQPGGGGVGGPRTDSDSNRLKRSCLEWPIPTSFHPPGRGPHRSRNEGRQERHGRGSREQTATYPDYSQRSRPYAISN